METWHWSFIDRTCQPNVEPETSLGVQASKAVHQCLFSRIALQRQQATGHFLNRFGKPEAGLQKCQNLTFPKEQNRKRHPQVLPVISPNIFRTLEDPQKINSPAGAAHAASPPQGPKASHGRGNLRGRGQLLATGPLCSWKYRGVKNNALRISTTDVYSLQKEEMTDMKLQPKMLIEPQSLMGAVLANKCAVLKAYIFLKSKATSPCNYLVQVGSQLSSLIV